MSAVKERAIQYINIMPEEHLASAVDYLRFLSEPKYPFEVTTKEEFYKSIDEGLEDIKHGRVKPLDEAMQNIRKELAKYGV